MGDRQASATTRAVLRLPEVVAVTAGKPYAPRSLPRQVRPRVLQEGIALPRALAGVDTVIWVPGSCSPIVVIAARIDEARHAMRCAFLRKPTTFWAWWLEL